MYTHMHACAYIVYTHISPGRICRAAWIVMGPRFDRIWRSADASRMSSHCCEMSGTAEKGRRRSWGHRCGTGYTMPQAIYASKIQGSKIELVSKWSGKNDRAQGAQNLHCMLGGVEIDKPYTANFYSRRWRARSCRPHWGEAASGRA